MKISPLDRKQIGPGSVDLRLGYVFRVFKKINKMVVVDDSTDYKEYINLSSGHQFQNVEFFNTTNGALIDSWLEIGSYKCCI